MRKFLIGCAALALIGPAVAADNFPVKDANGTTITKRAKDVGSGVQADLNGILNTSNTQIDPATNGAVDGLETLAGTTNTALGAPGATTCATDTGSCDLNAKLSRIAERLTTLDAKLATIDASLNDIETASEDPTIPAVKIDPTTPGTTDAISLARLGANAVSVGNGTSGTGVQRVTLASDGTGVVAATQSGAWNTNLSTATTRIVSAAASTNLTAISSSACVITRFTGYNAAASARYLKIYNIASGSVTVGTSTIQQTFYLPATTAFSIDVNRSYSTACSFALTTGSADADTGALTAADVLALNVESR